MGMMFAARHAGIPFIDCTRDGQKMAEAQLRFAADFGIDCLLTCSDPARRCRRATARASPVLSHRQEQPSAAVG